MSEAIRRTVIVHRADHDWPVGYWPALVGLDLRIPAMIEDGCVLAGYLVAAEDHVGEIVLTFSDLTPEGDAQT